MLKQIVRTGGELRADVFVIVNIVTLRSPHSSHTRSLSKLIYTAR